MKSFAWQCRREDLSVLVGRSHERPQRPADDCQTPCAAGGTGSASLLLIRIHSIFSRPYLGITVRLQTKLVDPSGSDWSSKSVAWTMTDSWHLCSTAKKAVLLAAFCSSPKFRGTAHLVLHLRSILEHLYTTQGAGGRSPVAGFRPGEALGLQRGFRHTARRPTAQVRGPAQNKNRLKRAYRAYKGGRTKDSGSFGFAMSASCSPCSTRHRTWATRGLAPWVVRTSRTGSPLCRTTRPPVNLSPGPCGTIPD